MAWVVSVRSPWALLEPSAVDGSRHVPELKGTGPVTTTLSADRVHIAAAPGVYAPQHDSHLLIDVLEQMGRIEGRTAVDLCTGSGVVAIAAAQLGAAAVTAWDVCPVAVQCARSNAAAAGVHAEILEGPLEDAIGYGPFDIVLSNPPYVPTPTSTEIESVPADAGPPWAWNAGPDGRLVLDQLREPVGYVPIDVSEAFLHSSAVALSEPSAVMAKAQMFRCTLSLT